jgi:hypothetical protein
MHAVDDLHEGTLDFTEWDKINEAGNCFYDREVNINTKFQKGSADDKCFVTPYSKTDAYEDHAEIFSALIQGSPRLSATSAIAAKAEDVKKYLEAISPSMNEEFWDAFQHDDFP